MKKDEFILIDDTPKWSFILFHYIKNFGLGILLTWAIIFILVPSDFFFIKVLLYIFLFFIYSFNSYLSRFIYKLKFDDSNNKLTVFYFNLWRIRKQVAYSELHPECVEKYFNNKKRYEIILYRKSAVIIGKIFIDIKGELTNIEQVVCLSKRFYELKLEKKTWQVHSIYTQQPLFSVKKFKHVKYFEESNVSNPELLK